MKQLQQKYNQLATLFDARNFRERVLIAGLLGALLINAWLLLFNDHLSMAQQKLDLELTTLKQNISTVDKTYDLLLHAKNNDPDRDLKNRLSIARQHIATIDTELQLKMKGLILPTQMAKILEQVLSQQSRLHFKRIQSLPAKPLLVKTPDSLASNATNSYATQAIASTELTDIGVFQHGIEMEFTGSYLETLNYLTQLRQLPWNFYWDDVLIDVVEYPKAAVIIRVHTLSLNEGWLGV